jgi:hypothetical protein
MTLVLAVASERSTVVLCDRRLTAAGEVESEEWNKVLTLILHDARMVVAFTGMARVGTPAAPTFLTGTWLPGALASCSNPNGFFGPTVENLRNRADADIGRLPVAAEDRRLSIVIVGYWYRPEPHSTWVLVSNFEEAGVPGASPVAWPRFKATTWPPVPAGCVSVGAWGSGEQLAVDRADPLARLAWEGHMSGAIDKGVEVIREVGALPKTGGTIGEQVTSVVVPAEADSTMQANYHSAAAARMVFWPGHVEGRGGHFGRHSHSEASLKGGPRGVPGPIISGPRLRPTRPCYCGSGLRFKDCHGGARRR